MPLMFPISDTFDPSWFAEKLRDDHGYLGPDDNMFYPNIDIKTPEEQATPSGTPSYYLVVEARRSAATPTPIDESDRSDIQAIIDAHDGSPPTNIQVEQTAESNARTRAKDAIQTLENAHANWGSLTNAQKDAALKLVVIAVAKVGRLILRKFDD